MKRNPMFLTALSALMLLGGSFLAFTGTAEAHERRAVGQYTFVVGWVNEPALVNQPNSIDLRISKTEDNSPVLNAHTTLKAQVTAFGKTADVPLTARFNTPGAYNGYLFPTQTGEYTFTFTGTVDGAQVNEKFVSGPGRFSSIEQPNYFPAAPGAAAEPDDGLEQRIVALESAEPGSTSDSTALIVGVIGIVLGAAGLAAGGLALSRSKS